MNSKAINYGDIISVKSLFSAWEQFRKGKRKRKDVQMYERHLEDNIFRLHYSLKKGDYRHDIYKAFYVNDPKQRHIHKATVKDRLVHQALYSTYYPVFDPLFIYDSYSCRIDKGSHKALKRLQVFLRRVSGNYSSDCYVLKCDIKKFFASVDNQILLSLLEKKIKDKDSLWLIREVLDSFSPGLPLGNLTSQIFANVYLNELDQYIKHTLRIKHYVRYCDDFVIVHNNPLHLRSLLRPMNIFLKKSLRMQLHPQKIYLRQYSHGVDFLGYILLPHYILPRTKTKRRLQNRLYQKAGLYKNKEISRASFNQTLQSYLGYLQNSNSHRFTQHLLNNLYLKTS